MVFCGTPSKACAPCRARKTKCDQSIPSCSQCLRAGRKCMGYRDEQSLVFRDETKKVVRKAKAVKPQNRSLSSAEIPRDEDANLSERSTMATDVALDLTTQKHGQIVFRNSPILLDEQCACFFFHHFTYANCNNQKARLDFLPRIYTQLSPGSPLADIIISIGMAAIANKVKCPEMMFAARRKQTSVLRATNLALQDREDARSDATLLTVLMLGTFEIVAGLSLDTWTEHIIGATAIAQIRGRKQAQTATGRLIFHYLRNHVVVGCLQRDVAIPQFLIDWMSPPAESETLDEIQDKRLFVVTARLCALRSDFKARTHDDLDIVNRAHTIDADLEDWVNRLPCQYAYITRKKDEIDDSFLNYYHVYRDYWVTQVWNMYRCVRILTHEVIMECINSRSMTTVSPSAQRRKSDAIIAQLSDEIAASVPFFLQGDHFEKASSYTLKAGVVGQSLIWPLYVIAQVPQASSSTRIWSILQMEKIGRITGVRTNTALADFMKKRHDITV